MLIVAGAGLGPASEGLIDALHAGNSVFGYVAALAALCVLLSFIGYAVVLNLFGLERIVLSQEISKSSPLCLAESVLCGLFQIRLLKI